MEIEKLIVMTVNDITYFLLKKGAHIITSEIVALERDFHILIEANIKVTVDILKSIETMKKAKDHPELKYYSSLSESIGNLQGIYDIAPFLSKVDFESSENELKIELFVKK
jgi:hypothetical protein